MNIIFIFKYAIESNENFLVHLCMKSLHVWRNLLEKIYVKQNIPTHPYATDIPLPEK